MTDKELQVKDKQEIASPAEQTKPGLVFTPEVDIFESETEITLLADLPGVKSDQLDIDLRENTLTISGELAPLKNEEEEIFIEYETGKYYRQFTISQLIDQEKINAELKDGVLRLRMPKAQKAVPKKIAITT